MAVKIPLQKFAFSHDVTQGVLWLNSVMDGWETEINPKKLDLESATRCILGQVFSREAQESYYFSDGYEYGLAESRRTGDWSAFWKMGFHYPHPHEAFGYEIYFNPNEYHDVDRGLKAALENAWLKVLGYW